MIRKPTSGDSEQREREAERARKQSKLSAGGLSQPKESSKEATSSKPSTRPAHGSSDGESAHGAIPRQGIEFEHGD